jgi:hypothetical protein
MLSLSKWILALLILSFSPSKSFGYGDTFGLSPFWDWQTLTTEHFIIHYPKELAPLARRSAELYEEAHQK